MLKKPFLLLLLLCACFYCVFAQRVSLHAERMPLEPVLNCLQKQAPFAYLIDGGFHEKAWPVTITFKDIPLEKALELIFRQQPFGFEMRENLVRIRFRPGVAKRLQRQAAQPLTARVHNRQQHINPEPLTDTLQEVTVYASTGYTQRPQAQLTGAVDVIDLALFNRRPGSQVLERLENLTPGLLFNHGDAIQTDELLIRGRSTLFANARPLIVLDQFPYEGDPGNIHPQDIASVTILKDAAATSIWGARAANGVIVYTTRTGSGRPQQPSFSFGSYFGLQPRPDLSHVPAMSSADFISLEQQLFHSGYYTTMEKADPHYRGYPPLTPVVETLIAERDGLVTPTEAASHIETFKRQDVQRDISRYLYQNAFRQQYTLNYTDRTRYVSAGHDRHTGSLTGQQGWRSTLRAHQQAQLRPGLQFRTGVYYTSRLEHRGGNDGTATYDPNGQKVYPYARLADDRGNPLPLYLQHRQSFTDAAPANGLLDWQYRPLERLYNETQDHQTTDLLGTVSLNYRVSNRWETAVHYQHERQQSRITDLRTADSYFVRDLVNDFTQTDTTGAVAFRPIPVGDISDQQQRTLRTHQARAAVHYNRRLQQHHLSAQAGAEVRHFTQASSLTRVYHALEGRGIPVDTATFYPVYSRPGEHRKIDMTGKKTLLTDRFLSAPLLADYRYRDRFLLSASVRADHARLYDLAADQSGAPFWSVGTGWLGRHMQLRTSYGVQGNIARQVFPQTTNHAYPGPAHGPGPELRWERSHVFNISVHAQTRSDILSGKVSFYHRYGSNLLGEDGGKLANNSGLQTVGSDLSADYRLFHTAHVSWETHGVFSFSKTTVRTYTAGTDRPGKDFHKVSSREMRPVTGRAPFGLYSFPWRGLDPLTGDPLGVVDGTTSGDWPTIYNKTTLADMDYHGTAVPTVFGSLRQKLRYKHLSLSVMVSYQLGYYFRKSALFYTNLISKWDGHGTYAQRWQQPGDENRTHVPSLRLRPNAYRDNVYRLASVHVLKGDHIRLEDIRLTYTVTGSRLSLKAVRSIEWYAHLDQVAVIRKANPAGIDPHYNGLPAGRSQCTIGLTAHF